MTQNLECHFLETLGIRVYSQQVTRSYYFDVQIGVCKNSIFVAWSKLGTIRVLIYQLVHTDWHYITFEHVAILALRNLVLLYVRFQLVFYICN